MTLKKLSILLITVLMLLSGCVAPVAQTPASEGAAGEAAVSGDEVVTIDWWTVDSEEYSEAVQRAMAAKFEESHPNIKVNVTVLPADGFDERMTHLLLTNQPPITPGVLTQTDSPQGDQGTFSLSN